ncbi:MAG: hypothetical protein AAB897_03865 [Patescibacteria group bacterium]
MKYDIYFHDDFDGRASAAAVLAFLRSPRKARRGVTRGKRGDEIEHYTPVNYDVQDQWLKAGFFQNHKLFRGSRNPAIIVDFLYHPDSAWWFDHHETSFKRADWGKKFRPSKFHHWDPKYPSCCHQVLDKLTKTFGWKPPAHLKELAKWLDVVDGAHYKSAKQTIELKEPALQLGMFIDEATKHGGALEWIIRSMAEKPLGAIIRHKKITPVIKRMKRKIATSLSFYRKNLQIYGRTTLIDTSGGQFVLRFAPYYLVPGSLYNIRMKKVGMMYGFTAGVNPWRRKENKIHIGKLLFNTFGVGGGHPGAGGTQFKTRDEARRGAEKIIKLLNRE